MDFPRFSDPGESPADQVDVEIVTPEQAELAMVERLQRFSAAVAKTRDRYVAGRRASGLEKEWLDAEDAYNGIDSANRATATMMDAVAAGYPVTSNQARPTRSTVFVGVTRQKTNTAEARIADILLPTDDRNWGIKPTPNPKLTRALKQGREQARLANAQVAPNPAVDPAAALQGLPPGQAQQPGQAPVIQPGQAAAAMPQPAAMTPVAQAAKAWADALMAAEAMEREIDDALVQSDWNSIQRQVIHDAAVLGTGVCKGPVASISVKKVWTPVVDATGNVVHVLEIAQEINPNSEYVSPWNFFPDPSCGVDIHAGNGCMELKFLTARKLRELAKQPGYLRSQIAKVLEEGPMHATGVSDQRAVARMRHADSGEVIGQTDLFELWEYWGDFDADDLRAAGVEIPDDGSTESILHSYSGCVVMVNSTVIKAFLHPMSTGDVPYDVYVWEKRSNSWAGYGVPHLVKWQQKVINSAWRMMMDNAGSTVGDQIVVKAGSIQPADKKWEISGRKIWWCTDEGADVRQSFATFGFNSHQNEYAQIIQLAEQFMDQESGVPQIAQGEAKDVPETVGGMQILMASANTVVRRLVKQYDDMVTRPHIRRYYDWMMEHSEKPEIKGDFSIDARGSSALVTRDIQNQAVIQLLQVATNPVFGTYVDPKKLFEKALQAQHLDPVSILRSEEEIAQIEQQQAGKGPSDPKVQAAMINAQAHLQVAQARTQGMIQLEAQRAQTQVAVEQSRSRTEQTYAATEAQMVRDNHASRVVELQWKERMALLDYANKRNLSIEQVQAEMAKVQMQEQTKREMAQTQLQMAALENERGRQHDLNMHTLNRAAQEAQIAQSAQLKQNRTGEPGYAG